MKAYTYIEKGKFALIDKPKPELQEATDAIVRVTLGSICSSDLHIKHGSVPRAVPGITVGHEMVGVVEEVGADVKGVKVGDRVTVNVETFCGECFYCRHGYVNNCTYDAPQILPLPDMYGKNLTFKTGGVDGCDCEEVLRLIEQGKIDTTPLITHRFPLDRIEEAYRIFENKEDGVIKIAVYN